MVNSCYVGVTDLPELSIVIPCHNEELVVESTVRSLVKAMEGAGILFEILCVNNASSDHTENVLLKLASENKCIRYVNTPPIAGYGVAVRWGLEFYSGRAVVIVMADGSEEPEDVIAFYRKIVDGFDCVFGDRFSSDGTIVGYPRPKLLLNRLGNLVIAWITRTNYRDFTNGFKCYQRHVIDNIKPLCAENFNLTIEMSIGAVLSGARYAVVPNAWKNRDMGTSKFKLLKQSALYLMTIIYCWIGTRLRGARWSEFQDGLRIAKTSGEVVVIAKDINIEEP